MANRLTNAEKQITFLREQVDDESLYGVTPATGTPKTYHLVSEQHKGKRTTKRSQTAKSNRLPGPVKSVMIEGEGGFNFEVAPGAQMDEVIEMGVCNTWSTPLAISAITISFVASTNKMLDSGNGFTNIQAETWITIAGAAETENVGDAWVAVKTSNGDITLAFITLADETAGATVTVTGKHVRNGTKFISTTVQREHTKLTTDRYQSYKGFVGNELEVKMSFEEIITATLSGMSKGPTGVASNTSVWGVRTPSAAESIADTLSDSSNNMRFFRVNGVLDGNVSEFSWKLANNVQKIPACQVDRPIGQSLGTAALTGTLNGYLVDADGRHDAAFNHTPQTFHVAIIPTAGPRYYITIWRAKFNELGDSPKESNEGPANLNYTWEAEESTTVADAWIQISRLG